MLLMPPRTGGTLTPERCNDPAVGTPTGYRHHIEKRREDPDHLICAACRASIARNHARYRKRRILAGATTVRTSVKGSKLVGAKITVDPAGTRRRLHALFALGYSYRELGRRLGTSGSNVRHMTEAYAWTYPETRDKVIALYDELSMLPPDRDNMYVKGGITKAKRAGVVGPLAWDDDTIDDPYALPSGLNQTQVWNWYSKVATLTERMEWVLTHGLPRRPK